MWDTLLTCILRMRSPCLPSTSPRCSPQQPARASVSAAAAAAAAAGAARCRKGFPAWTLHLCSSHVASSRHGNLPHRFTSLTRTRAEAPGEAGEGLHAANDAHHAASLLLAERGIKITAAEIDAFLDAQQLDESWLPGIGDQLAANLSRLSAYLREDEIQVVSDRAPQVLLIELDAWFAFLEQYGFTSSQVAELLCQVRARE